MFESFDEFKNRISYDLPEKRSLCEILPDPEYFNKYDEETQMKMIEWAKILAEKDDRIERMLIEERLRDERAAVILNFIVYLVSIFATLLVYFLSDFNLSAFLILTIPLMNLFYIFVSELNNEKRAKKARTNL